MRRVASIATIVEQHAEDSAFLCSYRRREIDGAVLGEIDIGRVDQRLDANLEGLFASGEAGWKVAAARVSDYAEPGELFVMAALALHWGEAPLLSATYDAAASIGEAGITGFSAAIARTPREKLRHHVAKWLDAGEPLLRCMGLSALWHHRADPGSRLSDLILSTNSGVRLRAIRLAGALMRRDLLPRIIPALESEGEEERLEASISACLLREAHIAYPVLDKLVLGRPDIAATAFDIRILSTPVGGAKKWLQECLNQKPLRAAAIAAVGLLEDKSIMPWLIEKMRDPETVFSAGLALRDLFDVDFNDTDLFTIDPAMLGKGFEALEDLALPIASRVEAWWDQGRRPASDPQFLSMRRQRLQALRDALSSHQTLADWRRSRRFPAWM